MSHLDTRRRPTLLVFTLGPEGDCERRPLLPSRLREIERDLRATCTAAALEAGRSCGFRLEVASRRGPADGDVRRVDQRGATFGERLVSTLAGAWERNPDGPVVLVGGDIPRLSGRHLRRAVAQLEADRDAVVVGPSPDGGFYLLATARPLNGVLEHVRWCRPTTRDDLVRALAGSGRTIHLLEPLADLDRPDDLAALLASGWSRGAAWLTRRLREALASVGPPRLPPPLFEPALAPAHRRRGPPR